MGITFYLYSANDYLVINPKSFMLKSKGYEKGHKLNKDDDTRGITDTWEDADKNNWKIKID